MWQYSGPFPRAHLSAICLLRTKPWMQRMVLTDMAIRGAKPRQKPFKMFDRNGLFLLVNPGGSKLWRWRYRFDGKEKLMALGEYPFVDLEQALELHLAVRRTLAAGIDPMAERKAEIEAKQREASNSFEKIARKWWEWWAHNKSLRHADTVLRRLEADVFPAYGHKLIDTVGGPDIRELMLAVERREARDVAKRIYQTTGQIFRYAVANGLASRNPAAGFNPRDILAGTKAENFARVEARELPELLAKMDDCNGVAITRFAMKLMAYTFVRTSELIAAPWVEFDLDNARWIIPKHRMKMGTAHIVPLSRQSVEVLRALKLLTGNSRLAFPGANDKNKPMSNNTILTALYRLGYQGRMTGHGFRRLASTILHESGFDEAHIEVQLSHLKRNKAAAAYNHAKYINQRTVMMQWWADYLDDELTKGRKLLAA